MVAKTEQHRPDWWPCACVKRDRAGNMTHIKLHPPTKKRCRTCGCTKADADAMKNVGGAK